MRMDPEVHEQYLRVQQARRLVVREAERLLDEGGCQEVLRAAVEAHRIERDAFERLLGAE
jgi:hypothetical protein